MKIIYEPLKTVDIDWEFIERYFPTYKTTEEYKSFEEYQKIIDGNETGNYYTSVQWGVGLSQYHSKANIDGECRKRQSQMGFVLYNKAIENFKNNK